MLDKEREEKAKREFNEYVFSKRYPGSLKDFLLEVWLEARDTDSQYEELLREAEEKDDRISELESTETRLENRVSYLEDEVDSLESEVDRLESEDRNV